MLTTRMGLSEEFPEPGDNLTQSQKDEREEYRDLVDEFEQIVVLLMSELAETIEARDSVGVVFPERWQRSLRLLGAATVRLPSLIVCAAAPAGYEDLRELYHDWTCYCEALGNHILDFVDLLELGFDDAPLNMVLCTLSAVAGYGSARKTYFKALFANP